MPPMSTRVIVSLAITAVAASGCNQVFGLDPPGPLAVDAAPSCDDPSGAPDEDGDGVRDACDDCPQVPQGPDDHGDLDGDGVGDACDPHPMAADRLVAFDGFSTAAVPLAVESEGGTWFATGGALTVRDVVDGADLLARLDGVLPAATVDTSVTIDASTPDPGAAATRSVGVWAGLQPPTGRPAFPPGAVLEVFAANGAALLQNAHLADTRTADHSQEAGLDPQLFEAGATYRLVLTCEAAGVCAGRIERDGVMLAELFLPDAAAPGAVGLRSHGTNVAFHYLAVYTPAM